MNHPRIEALTATNNMHEEIAKIAPAINILVEPDERNLNTIKRLDQCMGKGKRHLLDLVSKLSKTTLRMYL